MCVDALLYNPRDRSDFDPQRKAALDAQHREWVSRQREKAEQAERGRVIDAEWSEVPDFPLIGPPSQSLTCAPIPPTPSSPSAASVLRGRRQDPLPPRERVAIPPSLNPYPIA